MALFADMIGEPADGQQVVRLKEREAVLGVQTFASENFRRDGLKARIGYVELPMAFLCPAPAIYSAISGLRHHRQRRPRTAGTIN